MATVYKKFNWDRLQNRQIVKVDSTTKSEADTIVNNFVTYFKSKHL